MPHNKRKSKKSFELTKRIKESDENFLKTNYPEYATYHVPIRKIFFPSVPCNVQHKELKNALVVHGKIDDCILKKRKSGDSYAFVTYHSVEGAARVVSAAGIRKKIYFSGQCIRVLPADIWHQPDRMANQNNLEQMIENSSKSVVETMENFSSKEYINQLNDYCLGHIFSFLSIMDRIRVERVCKRWLSVGSLQSWCPLKRLDVRPKLWCDTNKNFNAYMASPALPSSLIITGPILHSVLRRCGKFITEIDLRMNFHKLEASVVIVIAKMCPNLRSLYLLCTVAVTPFGVRALARNCPHITKLQITKAIWPKPKCPSIYRWPKNCYGHEDDVYDDYYC